MEGNGVADGVSTGAGDSAESSIIRNHDNGHNTVDHIVLPLVASHIDPFLVHAGIAVQIRFGQQRAIQTSCIDTCRLLQ